MFAVQQTSNDALGVLIVIAIIAIGIILRRRRRARMSPEERAAYDLRQEIKGLRRDVRNKQFD